MAAILLSGAITSNAAFAGSVDGGGARNGSHIAPDKCTSVVNQALTAQISRVELGQGAQVTCVDGQTYYSSTSPDYRYSQPQFLPNQPCTVSWYSTIGISQMQPNGFRTASWGNPPGPEATQDQAVTSTLLSLNGQNNANSHLSGEQTNLYTNFVYATYTRTGAGSNDGARCEGGIWHQCGTAYHPEGFGTNAFDPCIGVTAYAPDPPDCNALCEAPVTDLAGSLKEEVVAGRIQRYPVDAQPPRIGAVVNVPVQFYIPDWTLNGTGQSTRQWQLQLIGPPDPFGRSRVFTYLVSIGLQGVDWDFGDGQSAHFADESGFGQNVHPPDGHSTVEHAYSRITDPNPYRVTAIENWGVRVDKYWLGGHVEETGLESQFSVQSSTDVNVGQIESIPLCCTASASA